MNAVILFVALRLTSFHASAAPGFPYRVPSPYPDSTMFHDYNIVTNFQLREASAKKVVTLGGGSQCSFANKTIISAGSLEEGEITNSSNRDSTAVPLTLTCGAADSHVPGMITDGNTSTYWLSNGSNPLSKLDIDLTKTYQVSIIRIILLP